MPYFKEAACEERWKEQGWEGGSALQSSFPFPFLLQQIFRHLMPGIELWAETEYVVAATGVPLLAE